MFAPRKRSEAAAIVKHQRYRLDAAVKRGAVKRVDPALVMATPPVELRQGDRTSPRREDYDRNAKAQAQEHRRALELRRFDRGWDD